MISGFATPQGTKNFSKKNTLVHPDNYKQIQGLTLSNVGMGTYLGDINSETDLLVSNAVKQSIKSGVNVIDTAINYRSQKAERAVGKGISELVQEGYIHRDDIFICTKNGYVTNDGDINQDIWEYVKNQYTSKGIINSGDITPSYHCMTVPYLEDQLHRSLNNLDIDCIDLMYLHNAAEGQIKDTSKIEFMKKLGDAFEFYESKRKEGLIKFYGMATWECFRVSPDNLEYLSLNDIVSLAKKIGGADNGFKFIQLPFNMYYDQAYMIKNQQVNSEIVSILNAALNYDIGVFTSVPFMQGKLLSSGVMPEFGNLSAPLRALQFIRSTPGVLAPLVGQKSAQYVSENMEIMKIPPMTSDELSSLIKKLVA